MVLCEWVIGSAVLRERNDAFTSRFIFLNSGSLVYTIAKMSRFKLQMLVTVT